jgi:hypothetical protein
MSEIKRPVKNNICPENECEYYISTGLCYFEQHFDFIKKLRVLRKLKNNKYKKHSMCCALDCFYPRLPARSIFWKHEKYKKIIKEKAGYFHTKKRIKVNPAYADIIKGGG